MKTFIPACVICLVALTGFREDYARREKQTDTEPAGLTEEAFQKKVHEHPIVLVDFTAAWCAPCRTLAPIVKQVVEERKDKVFLLNIDIDTNKELSQKMNVLNIPLLMLYRNGRQVWTGAGVLEKKTLEDVIDGKPGGLTEQAFQKIVSEHPMVLINFSAGWCLQCRPQESIVNQVAEEKKDKVFLLNVDIDKNPELSQKMRAYSIPFLVLYRNGKPIWNGEGVLEKKTLEDVLDGKN